MSTVSHRKGLSDGYGVAIGFKKSFYRDDPDNFGKYHHGNLVLDVAGREYRCAIDIDSNKQKNGHSWCSIPLSSSDFNDLRSLNQGWHTLSATSTSGALDYIRSPEILSRTVWSTGDSLEAIAALEAFVIGTGPGEPGAKYFVFGEPFTQGLGVHNVHQNQGSKIGGGHDAENGIWQDGAVFIERSGGSMVAFLNKFSSQVDATDDKGRPA